VLRRAFPRALITTGVELELTNARGPVAKLGGDLGPLLDDPCWAGVEELVDAQILDVEQLRLGLGANRPEDLLFKEKRRTSASLRPWSRRRRKAASRS